MGKLNKCCYSQLTELPVVCKVSNGQTVVEMTCIIQKRHGNTQATVTFISGEEHKTDLKEILRKKKKKVLRQN